MHSRSLLLWLLTTILSLILGVVIIISLAYVYFESQLPDVSELNNIQLQVPMEVYTSDGKLIGEFGPIRRAPVNYDQIPPMLIKAFLATEDKDFFENSGVDYTGLLRAAGVLISTGKKAQGGSTITMQVAKNFYLGSEKTFSRKFEEILLAQKINQELSKEKILELYLNYIYFGQQAYGIAAAAQAYFGKTLDQLTLPEMAMIAGLPQAPSELNPISNPVGAKKRRDHVLERMYELGYIDQNAYQTAINMPLDASYHGRPVQVWGPYIGEMARELLYANYGPDAYTHSYKVYTTVDSQLQNYANQATRNGLLAYDQRHGYRGPITHIDQVNYSQSSQIANYLNMIPFANGLRAAMVMKVNADNSADAIISTGENINIPWSGISWARGKNANAILHTGDVIWVNKLANNTWQLAQIPQAQVAFVSLDPRNGAITSLVGGFDFRLSNFNRVVQAGRQPGSGFKPFIYAGALDKGYTLASVFDDAPIEFSDPSKPGGVWRPQNDTHVYYGPMPLREALARSDNIIAIKLLQAIGVPYAIGYAARFGFDPSQLPHDLTLALGTCNVTPLQMANAYSVFANGGYRVTPYLIDHIEDQNGHIIFQYQQKAAQQVLSPETEFLTVAALKDVIDDSQIGTARKAISLGRTDLAGKTGTSNDAWFNGFNGDIVAVSWVGFDQQQSLKEFGDTAALPIWMDFMSKALAGKPEHDPIVQPDDIVSVKIDPATGTIADPDQPNAVFEYFKQSDVPGQGNSNPSDAGAGGATGDSGQPIF